MLKHLTRTRLPFGIVPFLLLALLTSAVPRTVHAATSPQNVLLHCTSPTPCADVRSYGSGVAVSATAAKATGIAAATAAVNAPFGMANGVGFLLTGAVVGNDVNGDLNTAANGGVLGFSLFGYGVQGVTYNACNCGTGSDVTTFGAIPAVAGFDAAPGTGLAGGGNVGVAGRSLTRVGGLFLSRTGYGAVGRTFTGTGVLGVSRAAGGVALAATSLAGGPIFQGFNATKQVAALDTNGDLVIAGGLRTGAAPVIAAQTVDGGSVSMYGARQTTVTVEDVGRAELHAGAAQVSIEPAFAKTMEPGVNYMVFITPEGDNRGLYVTNRSATSFRVVESQGGHHTLTFSFRIVAHAFGSREPRLEATPVLPTLTHSAPFSTSRWTALHQVSE